jgi:hypothetical protein
MPAGSGAGPLPKAAAKHHPKAGLTAHQQIVEATMVALGNFAVILEEVPYYSPGNPLVASGQGQNVDTRLCRVLLHLATVLQVLERKQNANGALISSPWLGPDSQNHGQQQKLDFPRIVDFCQRLLQELRQKPNVGGINGPFTPNPALGGWFNTNDFGMRGCYRQVYGYIYQFIGELAQKPNKGGGASALQPPATPSDPFPANSTDPPSIADADSVATLIMNWAQALATEIGNKNF